MKNTYKEKTPFILMNNNLCKKCEVELNEHNLSKNLKQTCKSCYNENKRLRNAVYRENNRDVLRLKSLIYKENNKDKIKLSNQKYRALNKEEIQTKHEKASNEKYGMTEEKIKKINELWDVNFPKMKESYMKLCNCELVYKKNLTPRLKEFYMQGYNLI